MKILISACLMGENCKYNGGNNYSPMLADLVKNHEVITVCPEVLGGLSTPRDPAEIVADGRVQTKTGENVSEQFQLGARKTLETALQEKPDICILQSRSPSCGVNQRYDGSFSGTLISAPGITAQLLQEHGFICVETADAAERIETLESLISMQFTKY